MKRVIHGVEIDLEKKSMVYKNTSFDEMDLYRLQVAVKIMELFRYLRENFINTDEQLYLVACVTRELLLGTDGERSDDEAIAMAADSLDIVLISGEVVKFEGNEMSSAS